MSNDTVPASANVLPFTKISDEFKQLIAECDEVDRQLLEIDANRAKTDAELIELGAELADVHRQRLEIEDNPDEEAKDDLLYEAHWTLREKIEAIPAKTVAGYRVKARAIEMALHFDPQCEFSGLNGSFARLSQSLASDLHDDIVIGDQSPLERLIDAHTKAWLSFGETCRCFGKISEDDPNYPQLVGEDDRRGDEESEALMAVFSYPAKTLEEARIKAEFLLRQVEPAAIGEHHYRALLRSFLPAGAEA